MAPSDFGREPSTWDGLRVAPEPPYGAAVHVWRERGGEREWLLLHRRHAGSEDGDWAWTPPSGARLPDEPIEACARRELREEAGLELDLVVTGIGDEWALYVAETSASAAVVLDEEHDRYAWFPLEQARARCRPEPVADNLAAVAHWLEVRSLS